MFDRFPYDRYAELGHRTRSFGHDLASSKLRNCHRYSFKYGIGPDLGNVKGIYSDLLLHDMGQSLSDAGSYGTNPILVQTKDQANPLPVSDPEIGTGRYH